jgi:hypothetical protein
VPNVIPIAVASDLTLAQGPDATILIAQSAIEVYCFGEVGRLTANAPRVELISPRIASRTILLTYGPVSNVSSVIWNGTERVSDLAAVGLFGLEVISLANGYPDRLRNGDTIRVTYTQGYLPANVPTVFKTAVIQLASDPTFKSGTHAISKRRLGDAEVEYNTGGPLYGGGVSAAIAGLLAPYRDPRLVGI